MRFATQCVWYVHMAAAFAHFSSLCVFVPELRLEDRPETMAATQLHQWFTAYEKAAGIDKSKERLRTSNPEMLADNSALWGRFLSLDSLCCVTTAHPAGYAAPIEHLCVDEITGMFLPMDSLSSADPATIETRVKEANSFNKELSRYRASIMGPQPCSSFNFMTFSQHKTMSRPFAKDWDSWNKTMQGQEPVPGVADDPVYKLFKEEMQWRKDVMQASQFHDREAKKARN